MMLAYNKRRCLVVVSSQTHYKAASGGGARRVRLSIDNKGLPLDGIDGGPIIEKDLSVF